MLPVGSPAGAPGKGSQSGSSGPLCSLAALPRAPEEAEKTTTTYLDNGAHPAQGEAPFQALSQPVYPHLATPQPPPLGRLTICVCLSPPPDWARLDSDSSLFP